jgi:hypothetical protein
MNGKESDVNYINYHHYKLIHIGPGKILKKASIKILEENNICFNY